MINIFTKVQAPLCKMKSCLFLRLFVLETKTRPRPSVTFLKKLTNIFLVFSETRPYLGEFWEILFFPPWRSKTLREAFI